jgi:hypothetical protein
VAELDRAEIRASVIDRFSAKRMADGYEALYARMLGLGDGLDDPEGGAGGGVAEPARADRRVARSEFSRA